MNFSTGTTVALGFIIASTVSGSGGFTIDSWRMTTGVLSPHDSDSYVAAIVRNPLLQTVEAVLGNTRSEMVLDFSWDCRRGDFLIDASHETADLAIGSNRSTTSGQIVLTPAGGQGVELTLGGEYVYWAPSSGFLVGLTMSVTKVGIGSLYRFSRDGGPAVLEPPAGTLAGGTSLFLTADGASYRINFSMHSDTYQGGTDIIATGDGHVRIHLEAVGFPRGDANCDGCVDGVDIEGFALGFTDPAAYADQHPSCNLDNLDMNGDRGLTLVDVGAFVQTLLNG